MRKRMLAAAALITTAAVSAACDGSGAATGPSDGRLTAAQAASLNRAIIATGSSYASGTVPAGARGARAVNAVGNGVFSFTFDNTVPCTPSGNVAVVGTLNGTVDIINHGGTVQAAVGVKHQGCTVKTDDGSTFTLNGDPKIDVTLNAASGQSGLTALQLHETGAFTWSRGDGNSGRCTVDVSANLIAGTQDVRLSGTFCGFPVDGTVQRVAS